MQTKSPRWKKLLFYVAVLVGLPATGLAIGEASYLLAAIAGFTTVVAVCISFSTKRCPSCQERLFTISYPASHCPKCGASYDQITEDEPGAGGIG